MKKRLFFIPILLFCLLLLSLSACSNTPSSSNDKDITGVSFVSQTYDYDGEEKSLLITGDLPQGVSVSYTENRAINAGEYSARAVLSGEGYKTLTLNATLTINKAYYDMSNATWTYDQAFTFDGNAKTLSITGLPEGVSVKSYSNNSKTNAGNYLASATFNYDATNYHAPIFNACEWVINKAPLVGIFVESLQTVIHDSEFHLPTYSGTLPLGVNVSYEFDGNLSESGVNSVGSYSVKIVFEGANYISKTFECTFKIKLDLGNLAQTVINSFGSIPSPWEFLPESFAPENKTVSSIMDYSSFINISAIPKNGIGKQLNVVYALLNKTSTALSYVSPVYGVMNIIKSLYTTYLDDNPEDYKNFSDTASGITFTLTLTDTQYLISSSIGNVGVTIFADTETNSFGAKIQLTETTVLKYVVGENSLLISLNVLNSSSTQIEFCREDSVVVGMVYEYLTIANKEITATSAMIVVDEEYTTLIGTKGDFIPTSISRNCEVYKNSDGYLVGTEVREEMEIGGFTDTYNTLWYNLYSISGINTIKKVDEANLPNADTIYINGSSEPISAKLVGLSNLKKSFSRRFDIEFKTMYFYQFDQEKQEYVEVSMEIPMMFIQEEVADDFESNFYSENKKALTSSGVTLLATEKDKSAINFGYYFLLVEYDKLKDAVSQQDIIDFCKQ